MAESSFDINVDEAANLESLAEIELVVEEIIRSGSLIYQALSDGRAEDASDELDRLRSTGVSSYFSTLTLAAIEQQKSKARSADLEAISLAQYITNALPIFMSMLVIVTLLIIVLFSRSLPDALCQRTA